MSELEEAQKSLLVIQALVAEKSNCPENPKHMQLVSHVDLRRLNWLLSYAKKSIDDVCELNLKLATGLNAALETVEGGAKREQVAAILKAVLNDNGYNAQS